MKIYTGKGDRGSTSLFSGERVGKDHPWVDTYGEIDALNSTLGAAAAALPEGCDDLAQEIRSVQAELLLLGSLLATAPGSPQLDSMDRLDETSWRRLEGTIDRWSAELPQLTGFLLPGGHLSAGLVHVARATCRRAERRFSAAYTSGDGRALPDHLRDPAIYINRLSDYLFTLARECNRRAGIADALTVRG